jgi:hypothetical protein
MRRHVITAVAMIGGLASVATISCEQTPTGPSEIGTVEQLVQSLQGQGLEVSLGGEISPSDNGFFTVPARKVSIDGERLSAFEYATAERAAADAALISADAQPNLRAAITWVNATLLSARASHRALCGLRDRDSHSVGEVARFSSCDGSNLLSMIPCQEG